MSSGATADGTAPRVKMNMPLIGRSAAMLALQQEINRVARFDAKVLITGESGVGKEVVARAIHQRGPRASKPLTLVNCAGVPETLLESELFGHVQGSFTGAYRDKAGRLELAHMGTAFLDEIGEMTLRMQGLLLRYLETGEFQRVGADSVSHVDVRVLAATSCNLPEMVGQGRFRKDLFYRLNVVHLNVPPLRERREDIPALVDHFRVQFAAINRSPVPRVTPAAMKALTDYSWPGNVRELENVLERVIVTTDGNIIDVEHLSWEVMAQDPSALRPRRERRRTIVDDLYARMVEQRESFWTTVYPRYVEREITRANVREVVRRGLEDARGSYKVVSRLFNMESRDYKRFLNFLRKHDCQIPFKEYR
jgi:DNA-binding NtrC family response regulator